PDPPTRAQALIMSRGGAVPSGELRDHCATAEDALYIVGVWESEDHVRTRWTSPEFKDVLASVGFSDAGISADHDPGAACDRAAPLSRNHRDVLGLTGGTAPAGERPVNRSRRCGSCRSSWAVR